jgi:GT2 family glycosyltransferase
LKRDLYRELGGFDERFFLFFEDIDLCRRIHGLGKKVLYLSSLHVLDRKGRLSGSSIFSLFTRKTTRIHLASALKYFAKWGFLAPAASLKRGKSA